MRCHYLSDLHLETQDYTAALPTGDVLILAGDIFQAAVLKPARTDLYAQTQKNRARRLFDEAAVKFQHVLMVPGNHEHFDGVFEETAPLIADAFPNVVLLDDAEVAIGGVGFYGTTLWSDFEGGSGAAMDACRRAVGDFLLVQTSDGGGGLRRLQPEDTLAAHRRALQSLETYLAGMGEKPVVVISHHAPSRKSLNPLNMGNGRDGAYASALDGYLKTLTNVRYWVHGHTHVVRRYKIGMCEVLANCRGMGGAISSGAPFKPNAWFEV